ncbi:hypothetical protein BY458DRAFT_515301 [Sporodiniella umbellata]|nr:hypothetical protein BY458DRAFT_515301 [Sporodiniella umbellata]
MNATRKRTHLSSEKVSILEESFTKNILPDSATRSQLAKKLSVPERTVQIWFQNRRAKEKKNKQIESNESSPLRYEPTFRSMMTPEVFEQPRTNGRSRSISKTGSSLSDQVPLFCGRALSEGIGQDPAIGPWVSSQLGLSACPVQTIPLQPSMLRIGSWTRFSSEQSSVEWDLFCYVSLSERALVWKIRAGPHQFKIECGFDRIQYIQLQPTGQLNICTQLPLSFGMIRYGQDKDWVPCGDFTEYHQASIVPIHTLQGHFESLQRAILECVTLAPELAHTLVGSTFDSHYPYSISSSPELLEECKTRATTVPTPPIIPHLTQHTLPPATLPSSYTLL